MYQPILAPARRRARRSVRSLEARASSFMVRPLEGMGDSCGRTEAAWRFRVGSGHPDAEDAKKRKGRKRRQKKMVRFPFASFAKPLRPLRPDVRSRVETASGRRHALAVLADRQLPQ